jgi:hypothetical protein
MIMIQEIKHIPPQPLILVAMGPEKAYWTSLRILGVALHAFGALALIFGALVLYGALGPKGNLLSTLGRATSLAGSGLTALGVLSIAAGVHYIKDIRPEPNLSKKGLA